MLLMHKDYTIATAGAGYKRGCAAVLKYAYSETAGEHYSELARFK